MRYYENEFPAAGETVIANVVRITELGAFVQLLEYDNIEGFISLAELSRRRIRTINRLVRVNRVEILKVLRVDPVNRYIDLSKRRVSADDIIATESYYNQSKVVFKLFRTVAEQTNIPIEVLYETIVWPLMREYNTNCYEVLHPNAAHPLATVLASLNVSDELKDSITQNIPGIFLRGQPGPIPV